MAASMEVFVHASYVPLSMPGTKVSQSVIFIAPEVHMVAGGFGNTHVATNSQN